MTAQALQSIRVVELAREVPAAWCGRQFAQWGAEVVVLEPPGGSPLRKCAPVVNGTSLLWTYTAAGKRSAAVPNDREGLLDLLSRADVFVTDASDRELASYGMTLAEVHTALPGLVVVSTPAFGHDGPLAELVGGDLVLQALSGYLGLNGEPGRAPLKAPGRILAYMAGVSAFVAALAALVGRLDGGPGRLIEAAQFQALSAILPFLKGQYSGDPPVREGGPSTGVRIYACADGDYISLIPPTEEQKPDYAAVLGFDLSDWPDLAGLRGQAKLDAVCAFLGRRIARLPAEQTMLAFLQRGLVCGRIASPGQIVSDPHLAARGFFSRLDDERLGPLQFPGPPARLSRTPAAPPAAAPSRSAPFEALGWDPRPQPAPNPSALARRPLASVKVVDVTQAWVGPFAAMLLAHLGADVVKVESHRRPDVWRRWSANPVPLTHVSASEVNASPNYNSVNRNKRSLCLNLKTEEGRALFARLAADADIVMENYTPEVMGRFGLDHATLAVANPQLVMSSFCGFGKTGPLSPYKANGTSIEGFGGWDWLHRYDGGPPMAMGFYQADPISGYQMAAVTLIALIHQRRTGEGQAIDGAMHEAAAGYIGESLLAAQLGLQPERFANHDPDAAPHGVYPCAGEDRWVAIAVPDDVAWSALVRLAPSLNRPQFATHAERIGNAQALDAAVSEWTERQDAETVMQTLQAAGVSAGVVRSIDEALECPHLAARGWFSVLDHADVGRHRYNGEPWRFTGLAPREDLPPPRLGEHSRQILSGRLGLSVADIEQLMAADVTGEVLLKTPALIAAS